MMYLDEMLTKDNVVKTINQNMDSLLYYIPEVNYMINFDQKQPIHNYDLWNHVLLTLYIAEEIECRDFDVRMALLLHDIAKPLCFVEGKIRKYPDYAEKSTKSSYIILKRLGYRDEYINKILYLVKNHNKRITDKLINDDLELALKLYEVQYCDILAKKQQYINKQQEYLMSTGKKIRKRSKIK